MSTSVFGYLCAWTQPACSCEALYGVHRLLYRRFGLQASRFFSISRVVDELWQSTLRALPHLQWIRGIRSGVIYQRKIVGRWLVAKVEDNGPGVPGA